VEAFAMISSSAAAPAATTLVFDGTVAWIALIAFVAVSALAVLAAGWLSHGGAPRGVRPVTPPPNGGRRRPRTLPPVAAASAGT